MVIFHSFLYVYQRVSIESKGILPFFMMIRGDSMGWGTFMVTFWWWNTWNTHHFYTGGVVKHHRVAPSQRVFMVFFFYVESLLQPPAGKLLKKNSWFATEQLPLGKSGVLGETLWGWSVFFLGIELYSKDLSSKFVWQSCKNSVLDSFR